MEDHPDYLRCVSVHADIMKTVSRLDDYSLHLSKVQDRPWKPSELSALTQVIKLVPVKEKGAQIVSGFFGETLQI